MKNNDLQNIFRWLFASDYKYRILHYFINNPTAKIHIRGLQKQLKLTFFTTRHECKVLESIGFLDLEKIKKGHLIYHYYSLNKNFVFYAELKSMLDNSVTSIRTSKSKKI